MSRSDPSRPPVFNTTRWSVVEAAGGADSAEARGALEQLCRTYWQPVYAYARCLGNTPSDAEDLTQGFFTRIVEGHFFDQADRNRGRFRSFLLSSLKHFIFNEHAKASAKRRGGHLNFVPFDPSLAETKIRWEPADSNSPDRLFERHWALTLLDTVLEDLKSHYDRQGERRLFEVLHPCLAKDRDRLSYAELGKSLGLSEGAVKVAVHRMRKRYREQLRRRVLDTVPEPAEAEEELRHLFRALST